MSVYSAPGKIFILGEYAVLNGYPAMIASVGPRFELRVRSAASDAPDWSVAPQSPVARLLDWADRVGVGADHRLSFEDPFDGAGGFGASTAQFALAYRALADLSDWSKDWSVVWRLYRELMRSKREAVPPSGADLIAQWEGGVPLFSGINQHCGTVEDLWDTGFDWSSVLVFSATRQAGRKVATHDHLKSLVERGTGIFDVLEDPLDEGIQAVRGHDGLRLGRALDAYADALHHLGLESHATFLDRTELKRIPGVLGVKGAGAMQADSVLVLVDPASQARAEVLDLAKARGLGLLCDGLTYQDGVICDE